ncbi:MAG: EAL domain-containing protein, partial [Planctomycetaceae bacterium]|nr:EAL domain-containing protein [Planctomycetaceae bacterium]
FNEALSGLPAFISVPYSDQWGLWVTALHPMHDQHGRVEAVLGVDFPAAVWGRQIFNARLSVIGILAVIESILLASAAFATLTRFHLKQQQFAANRLQQFKTTLDQTLDSVFMFRPGDFRFIYVNEGARQLLGYSEEQYLQMTPLDIVPGFSNDDLQKLTRPLTEGTHQLFTFETTHRHINGHEIPVELSLQFVHQSTDTPRFVGIVRDISERKKIEKELMIAARLDRLTGLPNRALFHDRLKLYIERTRQVPGYQFALMFLDFDRFKVVNDSLGHDVGDALLREIAVRLRDNLSTTDSISTLADGTTVSRLGGDEFVVILDDIDGPEAACQSASHLISALGEQYQLGDHAVRSNASIGIVCSHVRYQRPEDMLRDADTAMYEAKARGKACYVVFDDSMREAAQQRQQTETELRSAIGTEQLSVVWQPIVSLEDGKLHGVEAIIRWDHPTRGMIPPEEFLPIAEETRLSLPLSDWVMRTACAQFVDWHLQHVEEAPRYVSINLSERQLMQDHMADHIIQILNSYGMKPQQLQIEVTESEIMAHRVAAGEVLHALSQAGIRLAIDDFGTGYSSLACLQEFPFTVLKMDRTFVANLNDGHDVIAVAHSVVTLAENIGIACIAEGIEDPVQLAVLQSMNCGYGQGNFLCPPGTAEEIALAPWKHCHDLVAELIAPAEPECEVPSMAWRAFIGLED